MRRIFQEYLEGKSVHSIARRLNEEGVVSPGGTLRNAEGKGGWRYDTIKTILENPDLLREGRPLLGRARCGRRRRLCHLRLD